MVRWLTSVPMRLGGLGIRSAAKTAPAAHWASFADALEMFSCQLPALIEQILVQLEAELAGEGCLAQLCGATRVLDHAGFLGRPTWVELEDGLRPPHNPFPLSLASGNMVGNIASGDPRLYVCQTPNAFICVSSSGSILGPFWVHFGSILGPLWVQFGSILGPVWGPFWVHFGSILGPFWVHFGSILGPFWVHFA